MTPPVAGAPPPFHTWTLHVGESFPDVPVSNQFYRFIETIFHKGVTGGCAAAPNYCPGDPALRKQMAVFVLKAKEGSTYTPPPAVGVFNDVPVSDPFAPWIEEPSIGGRRRLQRPRRSQLLPERSGLAPTDGGFPAADPSRLVVHAARVHGSFRGRHVPGALFRLDRGSLPPRHRRRLRRQQLVPDEPEHARADGAVSRRRPSPCRSTVREQVAIRDRGLAARHRTGRGGEGMRRYRALACGILCALLASASGFAADAARKKTASRITVGPRRRTTSRRPCATFPRSSASSRGICSSSRSAFPSDRSASAGHRRAGPAGAGGDAGADPQLRRHRVSRRRLQLRAPRHRRRGRSHAVRADGQRGHPGLQQGDRGFRPRPDLDRDPLVGLRRRVRDDGHGDPVVLYDQLANRWVVSQFAGTTVPTDECVAVSTTSDATGTWNRYDFHLGSSNFFDYPKLSVWPDAYYLAMNVFNTARHGIPRPAALRARPRRDARRRCRRPSSRRACSRRRSGP